MSAAPDGRNPALAARGERPRYFEDPASDTLMSMVMALGTELAVTRERLDTVERLLERRTVLERAEIDAYRPDGTARAERARLHQDFLRRFLRPITQMRDRFARLK